MQYKKDNNRTNENLFRSVGIYPSQAPSFMFQQNIDNRQQTVISPAFQKFIDFHAEHGEKMLEDSDGVNLSY